MTRTEVLQEIRWTRFKEAYGGWQERRLTQEEAARLLGVRAHVLPCGKGLDPGVVALSAGDEQGIVSRSVPATR